MLLVQNAYLGNKLILETLRARSGVWQACAPQLVGIKTQYPTEQLLTHELHTHKLQEQAYHCTDK